MSFAFLTPTQSSWLVALIAEQIKLGKAHAKALTLEGHKAAAAQSKADAEFAAEILSVVTEMVQ